MNENLPTVFAVGAVTLMILAVLAMAVEQYMGAGLSFLAASLVLYFRQSMLEDLSDAG